MTVLVKGHKNLSCFIIHFIMILFQAITSQGVQVNVEIVVKKFINRALVGSICMGDGPENNPQYRDSLSGSSSNSNGLITTTLCDPHA